LGTAGALARGGIPVVVLERDTALGARWRSRYDRLRLHTVRSFSGLPGYRIPRGYGRWVRKDDFAAYLERYAERLGLEVRLGVDVRRVAAAHRGWRVETGGGDLQASSVVIATGKYGEPSLPDWPGRSSYRGTLLHAADFRAGDELAGKRLLVVGLGNSGAEIAAELTGHAASVAVSVRTPPPIVRRQMAGVPIQLVGIGLSGLPAGPVDRVGAMLRRVTVGNLEPYGLRKAAWGPFAARRPPVIDVGFLAALRARKLRIVPAVSKLTEAGVVLENGEEEAFDAIVAATGYATSLAGLVDAPAALTAHGDPRSLSPVDGLYFVGFTESIRGQLFEANREARAVARDLSRRRGGTRARRARGGDRPTRAATRA
jgi:cation diffusion facilitator CzcD-associated flavoprotein CzcO